MIIFQIRKIIINFLRFLGLNKISARLYYNYIHGFRSASIGLPDALTKCFELLNLEFPEISGDYYEFGVFKGYSLWHASTLAKKHNLADMRLFGFDSFMGLPREEYNTDKEFYEGQYACSKEKVLKNLKSKDADLTKIKLIEGFFDQTLNSKTAKEYEMKRVSLALIDCDLYSSTKFVLNFLKNLDVTNSIFVFDDWSSYKKSDEKGQRLAFREFLSDNKKIEAIPLFEYGKGGIVFKIVNSSQEE